LPPSLSYTTQLSNILNASYSNIGEHPVVIGETGCPFDLNGGPQALKKRGKKDWIGSYQERMIDSILHAIGEENLACYK